MPFFVRVVSCELYVCNVVLLRVFRDAIKTVSPDIDLESVSTKTRSVL